jgi:hypothetical protein
MHACLHTKQQAQGQTAGVGVMQQLSRNTAAVYSESELGDLNARTQPDLLQCS